jgi:phosphatidylinositol alpha-mannosyltransferase
MKIALVTPYDGSVPGGVAEHIAALRAELLAIGHEALVLMPGSRRSRIERVADGYRIGRAISLPSNRSRARITLDPTAVRDVRDVMRRERFDVVHVHAPHTPLLPYLALLWSDAANVGTFHAALGNRSWYLAARPVLSPILGRLHARIAVSSVAMAGCRHHFGGAYEIIPNGISVERFRTNATASEAPRAPDGMPRVLFVGRFEEPRKGFADLCRAMAIVQRTLPRARLVVVGPGDTMRARILAERTGVRNVDLVGQVPADDLPGFYAGCDVVCAPSTGRESFGMVLLEAMASGTPLVATAIPGYAAVATGGHDALLAPPGCPSLLAEALTRALCDSDLRARLRTAGLATARRYDWPGIARRILQVYFLTLRRQSKGSP